MAEQTVREQLVMVLGRLIDIHENPTHYPPGIQEPSYQWARLALDRARAETERPDCESAGYLLPCDTSCPCYVAGTEAQRERVGGGMA